MDLRLNKFLALAGVTSRRGADRLINSGRVRVNGEEVMQLGVRVDPSTDLVEVDGRSVVLAGELFWGALHKPRGVLTSLHDPFGRPDLRGLLRGVPGRVFPVGRLDQDSEGLLLITNDGELAYRLTHPRYEVEKEYRVEVEGEFDSSIVGLLQEGVDLADGHARATRVEVIHRRRLGGTLLICLTEGRKREVRRMAEAVGLTVTRLRRERVGNVELGGLKPNSWRELSGEETRSLCRLVGLNVPERGGWREWIEDTEGRDRSRGSRSGRRGLA